MHLLPAINTYRFDPALLHMLELINGTVPGDSSLLIITYYVKIHAMSAVSKYASFFQICLFSQSGEAVSILVLFKTSE